MPWMLLCHCLFALFAFSGDVFFASEYVADIFTSDVEVRKPGGGGGGVIFHV